MNILDRFARAMSPSAGLQKVSVRRSLIPAENIFSRCPRDVSNVVALSLCTSHTVAYRSRHIFSREFLRPEYHPGDAGRFLRMPYLSKSCQTRAWNIWVDHSQGLAVPRKQMMVITLAQPSLPHDSPPAGWK